MDNNFSGKMIISVYSDKRDYLQVKMLTVHIAPKTFVDNWVHVCRWGVVTWADSQSDVHGVEPHSFLTSLLVSLKFSCSHLFLLFISWITVCTEYTLFLK